MANPFDPKTSDEELAAAKAKLEAKRAKLVATLAEFGAGAEQAPKRVETQTAIGRARDEIKAINIELARRARARADAKNVRPPPGLLKAPAVGPRDAVRIACEQLVAAAIDTAPDAAQPSMKTLRKRASDTAVALEKNDSLELWEVHGG